MLFIFKIFLKINSAKEYEKFQALKVLFLFYKNRINEKKSDYLINIFKKKVFFYYFSPNLITQHAEYLILKFNFEIMHRPRKFKRKDSENRKVFFG